MEQIKEWKFANIQHKDFFLKCMDDYCVNDVYHKALFYCLGISQDTRNHLSQIYNAKSGCIKPECLFEGWITSGSARVIRLAFNLFCNGTPSVNEDIMTHEDQLMESSRYTVEDIFCCSYAPYFWEAIKIRYPEYTLDQ